MEYWLENTKKLESLRVKVHSRLFTLAKQNKTVSMN